MYSRLFFTLSRFIMLAHNEKKWIFFIPWYSDEIFRYKLLLLFFFFFKSFPGLETLEMHGCSQKRKFAQIYSWLCNSETNIFYNLWAIYYIWHEQSFFSRAWLLKNEIVFLVLEVRLTLKNLWAVKFFFFF